MADIDFEKFEKYPELFLLSTTIANDKVYYAPDDLSSAQLAHIPESILSEFKAAKQAITAPNITPALVAPDVTKHFMMAAPRYMLSPNFSAQENVEFFAQWEALKRALHLSGAKVTVVPAGRDNEGDQIFCRDEFFIAGGKVFIPDENLLGGNQTKDAAHERLRENRHKAKKIAIQIVRDFFADISIPISTIVGGWIDGGNIVVNENIKTVFCGMPIAESYYLSNLAQAGYIRSALREAELDDWDVAIVPLAQLNEEHVSTMKVQPDLYHLDLGMSEPLGDGSVIICPQMTSKEEYKKIVELIGQDKVIPISLGEAKRGSANIVSNGMNVVISNPSNKLRKALEKRGHTLITATDFGQKRFGFNNGDAHCLTNLIPR